MKNYSKNLALTVLFLIIFKITFGQNEGIKWKFFKNYTKDQKEIIKENWTQFYKVDIHQQLDSLIPIFPIKFDSYGSHYPDLTLFKGFSDKNFLTRQSDKNTNKYSLWEFLIKNGNLKKMKKNAANINDNNLKAFYLELFEKIEKEKIDGDLFYEQWDRVHDELVAIQLRNYIIDNKIKNVLFFIHGYNVPYSLANLQAIEFGKQIKNADSSKFKETLIVPIFWPSNNKKKCDLKDSANFSIANFTKFGKGGLKNGTDMWYYSNQAYYAAFGLRKLLNNLNIDTIDYYIFSHSLGNTVSTSALINTTHKLDGIKEVMLEEKEQDNPSKKQVTILEELISSFKNIPLPKQKIKVFMSAAAIPGMGTFKDMNIASISNKTFYVTINPSDPMLRKKLVGNTEVFNAETFSDTPFGCNYKKDADNVQEYFKKNGLANNILFKNVIVEDHDVFVYLMQPSYRNFINEFMGIKLRYEDNTLNYLPVDSLYNHLVKLTSDNGFSPRKEKKLHYDLLGGERSTFYLSIYNLANDIKDSLIKMERENEFNVDLLPKTQKAISNMNESFSLAIVRREVHEDTLPQNSNFMKNKILKAIDKQINEVCALKYPYYTYPTEQKKLIKFVSISTGNDLFTAAGLTGNFLSNGKVKSHWYWQRNDDRDYTGNMLIEIGTDYLSAPRKRRLKTYQTLLYGFDVYTPYFKDSTIFTKNDTFNVNDRPHASFQYFGWSKKGLSKQNKYRWSFTFKFGKIGGFDGRNFQVAVHQDISFSPRPRGWGAQIANNGRIGFSFEGNHEWLPDRKCFKYSYMTNSIRNLNLGTIINWKAGNYMTNASVGLQLSNKTFEEANSNFISHRPKERFRKRTDNLMYNISFLATGVLHNTMLEGYGVFTNNEDNLDPLTPKSSYVLKPEQVRRLIFTTNIVLSYTTRFFTVFYKWSSYSPETFLNDTGARRYASDEITNTMKIGKRWHHFAVVGISFNITKW